MTIRNQIHQGDVREEALDRNKTDLTHAITGTVMGYLAGAGFKPIETEVPYGKYLADIASFIYPTPTEMMKLKLNRRFDGTKDDPYESFVKTWNKFGFPLTVIVEVKVTAADFKKDLDTKFKCHPAHLCCIAYPKGIDDRIVPPSGWRHIICSNDGKKILKVYGSWGCEIYPQAPSDTIDLIAQIAIRRHHRTEYAQHRAMLKSWRANGHQ